MNSHGSHSAKSVTMALALKMAWELNLDNIQTIRKSLSDLKQGPYWAGTMATALSLHALTLTENNGERSLPFWTAREKLKVTRCQKLIPNLSVFH